MPFHESSGREGRIAGRQTLSEYQYYEFQAIDRPLGEADREALRTLSTRARITTTSFTNHYEWGDFKGDPRRLMEHWFDLHLYLANWGTRRLMIRLPKRLVDRTRLDAFLRGGDLAEVMELGEYLILDIYDDGDPPEYDDWDDGSGWLGALAPLRAELLSGDWRLPYLIWLATVDSGSLRDEEREPLPGIGPLTGGLEAFADFFRIAPDLVQAAAEAPTNAADRTLASEAIRAAVKAIPEAEKTALLHRLAEGDPHMAAEVRNRVRKAASLAPGGIQAGLRTVSALRVRAAAIHEGREAVEAGRREAERVRRERETEEAQRARLDVLRLRGKNVWREIESEIEKRNANGYDRATALLVDLRALAEEDDAMATFSGHLNALRLRHERKTRFIERLAELDRTG